MQQSPLGEQLYADPKPWLERQRDELKTEIKHAVEFVIDEVIEGVLEAAGKQLPLQVNGKKTRAGVDVLVARHAVGSITKSMTRC